MNPTTAYTPLESLLLFQSLAAFGTDPNVFARISDLLKNNILVRDGDRYDPGRLSPDALRELYLQLLREELRSELEGENPGDVSPSKKRKIQAPALPTIKDAKEYNGKLPQVVDRLYARYRDYMIRAIREDERRYELLKKEIKEIERGEWDERILKDDRRQRTTSEDSRRAPSVPPPPPPRALEKPQRPVSRDAEIQALRAPSPLPSPRTELRPEGLAISDVLNSHETPVSPRVSEKDSLSRVKNGTQPLPPIAHHRTPSNGQPHRPSPLQQGQRPPPPDWKWENYQAGPTQPYPQPLPSQGYVPYPPQQYQPYPPRGSFSGPLPPPQHPLPSSPHAAQNAIVLPPPNARGPGSPVVHLDQLADVAEQQFRPPQSPMMMQQQASGPPMAHYIPPTGPQMPQYIAAPGPQMGPYPPAPYAHPVPPQAFRNEQPQTGQPPAQWNQFQQFPPPPQNYYPPPTAPQAGQRPFPVRPDIPQPEQRQYNSPYNPSNGRAPDVKATPLPRPLLRDSLPGTPASRQAFSTGRATRWTPVATPGTPRAPRSPTAPAFEPLSPVLMPLSLAKPKEKRPGRPPRARASSTASPAPAPATAPAPKTPTHARTVVKKESLAPVVLRDLAPLTTSASETGDTTAEEVPAAPPSERKRKRSPVRAPSQPATHVLWTRNFPKISASALERIGAHRTASTFAQAIKERDAPGYKSVILRPQDLKSIRSAMTAGNRAATAAAEKLGGDRGAASVLLPVSGEVVPPRGIVNNAQLEKELMLMFANAVMFNPDPDRGFGRGWPGKRGESGGEGGYAVDEDGVVREARKMFRDVEVIVGELRSTEQRRSQEKEKDKKEDKEKEKEAPEKRTDTESVDEEGEGVAKKRKRG